jgi:dual specificity phosphatase 12
MCINQLLLLLFTAMSLRMKRDCFIQFSPMVSGEFYNRGEKIDSSKFGADPGLPTEISSELEVASKEGNNRTPAYRCKKCRRVVALQENVVDHVPGEGETSFEWNKRKSGNPYYKSDETECSSIFVEPLRWMTAGKLLFSKFLIFGLVLLSSRYIPVLWDELQLCYEL